MTVTLQDRFLVEHTSGVPLSDDVLALRALCFENATGETDPFDKMCTHVCVRDTATGRLAASFRMFDVATGGQIDQSYSAQFYDLTRLRSFAGRMLEIGRFCVDPAVQDPDVLRSAWATIAAHVDQNDIRLLFGCSSFQGVTPAPYLQAFALLKARYLAPADWAPSVKAGDVFRFAAEPTTAPDLKLAQAQVPPLLRSYLAMGGWVSDHAVIDHDLQTLHVFTGVDVRSIPEPRKRGLRALVR